jgi:hypothetical protein
LSNFRSELIRQAFDSSVGVLGERSKQLLIEDLKYHDVYLNDPDLNLQKLMKALKAILRGARRNDYRANYDKVR